MRQYGEVPPVLSTAQPPQVSATSGLGTGGGASVQSKGSPSDGQGFGDVFVTIGSNPSAGGSVELTFAETPPVLFFSADEAFGALTITGNDGMTDVILIEWAGTPQLGQRFLIHYEWETSQ